MGTVTMVIKYDSYLNLCILRREFWEVFRPGCAGWRENGKKEIDHKVGDDVSLVINFNRCLVVLKENRDA